MNKHEVTVHIWKNDPRYETVIQTGGRVENMGESFTGHASLKLQKIGAAKGDYFYLSFWPKRDTETKEVIGHFMPARLGTSSSFYAKGDFKQLSTSSASQTDMFEMHGKKPTTTYRFGNGLNEMMILDEMKRIANENTKWRLKTENCATAVARCLHAGTAEDLGCYDSFTKLGWTPNRLGKWCQTLAEETEGEVKHEGKRTFY